MNQNLENEMVLRDARLYRYGSVANPRKTEEVLLSAQLVRCRRGWLPDVSVGHVVLRK